MCYRIPRKPKGTVLPGQLPKRLPPLEGEISDKSTAALAYLKP